MDANLPNNNLLSPNEGNDLPGRKWAIAVALAMLVALALRLIAIDFHSFWFDEACTAQITESSFADLALGRALDRGSPPLYWLMAKAWALLFGRSEIGFRSLPVLCGVLTVPVVALLGRRLLSPKTGLIAAWLLAISPFAIELSNEARTYSPLVFLIALNGWFFVRWFGGGRLFDFLLYSLTTFLTCYSHYYALLLPFAHLATLLFSVQGRRLIPGWIGAMTIAALLWLPWLPAFLESLRQPGNLSRMSDRWPFQFLATPVVFSVGRTLAWRDSDFCIMGLAGLGTILAFCVPAAWGLVQLRRRPFAGLLLGSWLFVPTLLPLVIAILMTPIYHVRAGSVGLLAFLLLVAQGLIIMPRAWRIGLIGLIFAMTGVSILRYSTEPLKDDWRSATQVILANDKDEVPIVFDNDTEVTSFRYYVPRYGKMPKNMLAILSVEEDQILAVRYEDGRRMDVQARDYSGSMFSNSGCWLVLCVPSKSPTFYEDLFAKQDYIIQQRHHFYRIDMYRVSKSLEKQSISTHEGN